MQQKWWQSSVVYQVYPRSFRDSNGDGIGDIPGITERLEYIKALGADVIWLSPVYESPNDDNGYDISDYCSIMPEFGTMHDFDVMLEKAHSLGLRIVMDLVVNHTSDEHAWFAESRSSKDSAYRDYYIWRDPKEDGSEPNNWGSCFGGSAWKYDETTGQYFLHFFSPKQPDLNWDNPKVRDEVFAMMSWWLDKGVDGFRMDVISVISKPEDMRDGDVMASGYTSFDVASNGPHVHDYLREMNRRVLSRYDILTVGETPGVTVEEAQKYAGLDGKELCMCFQFEHMDLDADPVRGKYGFPQFDLVALKKNLAKWQTGLEGKAWNALYWNNHDQPRIVSRWGDDSDQYREKSAKMLATCLHMMKGTPFIYQGEELGMTNCRWESLDELNDIETIGNLRHHIASGLLSEEQALAVARLRSRDNTRTPFQWDSSANAGFTRGIPWLRVNPNYEKINAADQTARDDSVFQYYHELIALRKRMDVIVHGTFALLEADDPDLFVYKREFGKEKLLVVCNFSKNDREYIIPEPFCGGSVLIGNRLSGMEDCIIGPYDAFVIYVKE